MILHEEFLSYLKMIHGTIQIATGKVKDAVYLNENQTFSKKQMIGYQAVISTIRRFSMFLKVNTQKIFRGKANQHLYLKVAGNWRELMSHSKLTVASQSQEGLRVASQSEDGLMVASQSELVEPQATKNNRWSIQQGSE